jgi:glyoxylase-like metal-dependent hydrolase (beta-lactamase superfamily II)
MTTPAIITIHLPIANAYLISGPRSILVDSGAPGDERRILQEAARHGVAPGDIGLILLTHGHVDHFGSAAALRAATGAPIAVHAADAGFLRAGSNPNLTATGIEGRIFRPFLPWTTAPLEPDIVFESVFDLGAYGIAGELIGTPGHSPGSVSLLLPGGELIAGDLLRGGFMGGRLAGGLPNLPFYVDDQAQLRRSIVRALDLPATTIYVGHGGPLSADTARRRLDSGALSISNVGPAARA